MPPAGCERHARAPACLPGTGRVKTVARHFDWCCGQRMMALSRQASRLQPAFMDPRLAEIVDELLQIVQAHPQDLNWQPYYDDQQELLDDLHDHAERIRNAGTSRLPHLT